MIFFSNVVSASFSTVGIVVSSIFFKVTEHLLQKTAQNFLYFFLKLLLDWVLYSAWHSIKDITLATSNTSHMTVPCILFYAIPSLPVFTSSSNLFQTNLFTRYQVFLITMKAMERSYILPNVWVYPRVHLMMYAPHYAWNIWIVLNFTMMLCS